MLEAASPTRKRIVGKRSDGQRLAEQLSVSGAAFMRALLTPDEVRRPSSRAPAEQPCAGRLAILPMDSPPRVPVAPLSSSHDRRADDAPRGPSSCVWSQAERIGAGAGGFLQILRHAWFEQTDWEALLRREAAAPWVPTPGDMREIDFEGEPVGCSKVES